LEKEWVESAEYKLWKKIGFSRLNPNCEKNLGCTGEALGWAGEEKVESIRREQQV